MKPDISIIIPSYNKGLEIEYLLASLERQSFDPSRFEVIVVDDASTDRSVRKLGRLRPQFLYRVIRNSLRKGRAYTRNRGIEAAAGDLIIFLDAEMIVDEHFIQNHVTLHQNHPALAATGGMHLMGAYTIYDPVFSKEQKVHLRSIAAQDPFLFQRYKRIVRKAKLQKTTKRILTKEEAAAGMFRRLSFSRSYFPEIVETFGNVLDGYKLPWTSFLSGNVSVRKQWLEDAGGFDERFKGWGFEDWDLGYRLYLLGVQFIADPRLSCWHQEHPVSYRKTNREMFTNYRYYRRKHPYFETNVHAAYLLRIIDRLEEHKAVEQYTSLVNDDTVRSEHFINSLMLKFRKISFLLEKEYNNNQVLRALRRGRKKSPEPEADLERDAIRETGKYDILVHIYNRFVGENG